MITLLHIVGNRPQFIKLAVLYRELAKEPAIDQKIIHTGQHSSRQMSDIFFDDLQIPGADIHLDIPAGAADLFVANASLALQQYFSATKQALVIAYGDTNTTLAAAIAASRSGLALLHIEAGVRTGDLSMPEEINRLIADRLATINFCCTKKNFDTLSAEGYNGAIQSKFYLAGDLLYDAFRRVNVPASNITTEKEYIACTIHRAANIGNPQSLAAITGGLDRIHSRMPVVMPVHPHTQKKMDEYGLKTQFITTGPCGYFEMKQFIRNAAYVITDSGGTSREAYFSKKKSLVLMEQPFWPEIIDDHCAVASAADSEQIVQAFEGLPFIQSDFENAIFGDGFAAKKIRDQIVSFQH